MHVWSEKPEGKILFGRSRHRWENNIQMNMKEVGCEGGIHLAHVRDSGGTL
jgi:hypothetical protein